MVKVLFVCLGNICRSPTAEGVFRALVARENLQEHILIDSAGTHAYHIGEPPDARAREAAARRGIDIGDLRGRRATTDDIAEFDYILAMDRENLGNLRAIAPPALRGKIRLFLEFTPGHGPGAVDEVPDPYFGGGSGFDRVLDLVEQAAGGLLAHIRERHGL